MATKVYVVYYSMYGHVAKLAEEIKKGADSVEGVEAILWQVPETLSEEVLMKMNVPPKSEVPIIEPRQLADADALIFGFPTRYGMMAAQFKAFLDATGGLWRTQQLAGKPAGIFYSTGSQGGGQETTPLTAITQLVHHGLIYVPIGYTFATVKEEKKDWLEMTNSALAELFCMRQESRMWKFDDRKKMKHRRKQEKPRICPSVDANLTPQLSGDNDNSVEKPVKISDNTRFTSSPLSAVNSVVVGAAKKVSDREISPVKKRKGFRQIVEDSIDRSNRTNADLSSSSCYPCTEVTVIDTSVPICRSRKVMYSKGGIWKVRDKKAQSVSDQCTALDELLPTRKSPNRATSPSLRTVEDNNAANCSASIKIQTRGAHDFNNRSSSKD